MTHRSLRLLQALLLAASFALANPAKAQLVFNVNSTVDATDIDPGDGKCEATVLFLKVCTLRAAVMEANALANTQPSYVVRLAPGTYALTLEGGAGDSSASGDLVPFVSLKLEGDPSGGSKIVPGPAAGSPTGLKFRNRLFDVRARLTIEDVTIEGFSTTGYVVNNETIYCGTGGLASKKITIRRTIFRHNSHIFGVINTSSLCELEVDDSLFVGNRKEDPMYPPGAVLQVDGDTIVRRSAFLDNSTSGNSPIAMEIGLTAQAIVDSTTFAGNAYDDPQTVTFGSLISVQALNTESIFRSVTVVDNDVGTPDNNNGAFRANGRMAIANSILSKNSSDFTVGYQFASLGHNLIGQGTVVSGAAMQLHPTDVVGVTDPGLQPRGQVYHALPGIEGYVPIPGGLAHNRGNPDYPTDVEGIAFFPRCTWRDQSGFDRHAGGRCDIGAVEAYPSEWTFHAVKLQDAVDSQVGDGVCSSTLDMHPSSCTLRAAIMESNSLRLSGHSGTYRVKLAPGAHELSLGAAFDTSPASGDLDINEFTLTLEKNFSAQDTTIVRGGPGFTDRLFDVMKGELSLRDIRLDNPNALVPVELEGGAIRCQESMLALDKAVVTGFIQESPSLQGFGGALYAPACRMTIQDSMFSNNRAGYCGAIYTDVQFSEIRRTAFIANSSSDLGSALCVYAGAAEVTNTTFSGNDGGVGAAIFASSQTQLKNITVLDNEVDYPTGASLVIEDSSLSLYNSIVSSAAGPALSTSNTTMTGEGWNLLSSVTGPATFPNSTLAVNPGVTAELQPIGPQANPTWGHVPVPGGAARDGGSPAVPYSDNVLSPACSQVDQAGRDRAVDTGGCDVGAVEYFAVPPLPFKIFSDGYE